MANMNPKKTPMPEQDAKLRARNFKEVAKYMEVLKEEWEELPPYFITSSASKLGREELLAYIDDINKNL